jgi:hypothetical protein
MPSTRIPDAVRRVFADAFTARDIAEPLASFDADAPCEVVRAFMDAHDFEVVGIREDGHVTGYAERSALDCGGCGQHRRSFEASALLTDGAPLLAVLVALKETAYRFITVLGTVGGIVTRADIQKPPVRMWLFGIVTLVEMRFAQLIEEHCAGDSWREYLSEGRLHKAEALLAERSRRNQKLGLLDCLQFSDKGQIIARNEAIRAQTIFPSRSQAEAATKRLEQLRNNLAHAQDILTSDWDTIIALCEFLDSAMQSHTDIRSGSGSS